MRSPVNWSNLSGGFHYQSVGPRVRSATVQLVGPLVGPLVPVSFTWLTGIRVRMPHIVV
jgi:hypothetical protein